MPCRLAFPSFDIYLASLPMGQTVVQHDNCTIFNVAGWSSFTGQKGKCFGELVIIGIILFVSPTAPSSGSSECHQEKMLLSVKPICMRIRFSLSEFSQICKNKRNTDRAKWPSLHFHFTIQLSKAGSCWNWQWMSIYFSWLCSEVSPYYSKEFLFLHLPVIAKQFKFPPWPHISHFFLFAYVTCYWTFNREFLFPN